MTGTRRATTVAVTIAALTMASVLAACGASNGGKAAAKGGAAAPAGATTTAGAAGSGGASGLPYWDENRKMNDTSGYSSPISKALGYDGSKDASTQQAEFRQQEQKRQEAVAECMQAEGWQYKPYVQDQTGFSPPGYDLTRKEYVEKYGFGISTTMEENQAQSQNFKPENDPNFTYMNGLSQSDQEAYNKSLYGNQSFAEPVDPGSGGDTATSGAPVSVASGLSGCQGKAEAAVTASSGGTDADRAFIDDMNKRIQTFFEKTQADPRVVAANRTYATCMAGKGFPEIDKQETAYNKINEKMSGLYGGDSGSGGAVATVAAAPVAVATTAVGGDPTKFEPPQLDQAKLAEVKTYELAVAKADLACGKDVQKTSFDVTSELEKAFADANKADLDRLGALTKAGVRSGGQGG